ncbi:MAG: amino acid permease, partial [Myxococcales bacterium]
SRQVASVSPRFRSPQVAVWVSAAMALLVAIWSDAYSAITAFSTVALYASYGLPVLFGLRARDRSRGPWTLGRWSRVVNAIALLWIAACLVLFVLPPNQKVGYTFAGCLAALALYWILWMRRRFRGPPVLRESGRDGRVI